jgi:MoaA/NifB/PqqE/SkfB family radical SAM enzyme
MKDFKDWGIKVRALKDYNYRAMWMNLKTIRFGESIDDIMELPPGLSEFYDVGINTLCNAECPFCYVSASHKGENFINICETWSKWMEQYPTKVYKGVHYSLKPFQIAIGSTGEPTMHPQFTKFLETVYNTGVVPNYTTNGIILSNRDNAQEILEATRNFVGGVAVSFGNQLLRMRALKAIYNLLKYGECKVMIHHLISDRKSVEDFVVATRDFGKDIHYHVLLPLMKHGRSEKGLEEGVFEYMQDEIIKNNINNVAFGANFYPYLEKSKLPVSVYPQEAYSKNIILNNKVIITPSSFNLTPIEEIETK